MIRSVTLPKLAALFASLALASAAPAAVIWSATSLSSFKSLEEQDDKTKEYHSTNGSTETLTAGVFKFHKVAADRRCEAKGANGVSVTEGKTYAIGWRWKLSNTVNNNSIFQWKSYGSPMTQNYPFVIKMINGKITFQHYPGGGSSQNLFSQSVSANTFYSNVIIITTSRNASNGRVSYWFNGSQKVNNKACKSFDGSNNEPKWGIYGAAGTVVDSFVTNLKIGTTYADVAP